MQVKTRTLTLQLLMAQALLVFLPSACLGSDCLTPHFDLLWTGAFFFFKPPPPHHWLLQAGKICCCQPAQVRPYSNMQAPPAGERSFCSPREKSQLPEIPAQLRRFSTHCKHNCRPNLLQFLHFSNPNNCYQTKPAADPRCDPLHCSRSIWIRCSHSK